MGNTTYYPLNLRIEPLNLVVRPLCFAVVIASPRSDSGTYFQNSRLLRHFAPLHSSQRRMLTHSSPYRKTLVFVIASPRSDPGIWLVNSGLFRSDRNDEMHKIAKTQPSELLHTSGKKLLLPF